MAPLPRSSRAKQARAVHPHARAPARPIRRRRGTRPPAAHSASRSSGAARGCAGAEQARATASGGAGAQRGHPRGRAAASLRQPGRCLTHECQAKRPRAPSNTPAARPQQALVTRSPPASAVSMSSVKPSSITASAGAAGRLGARVGWRRAPPRAAVAAQSLGRRHPAAASSSAKNGLPAAERPMPPSAGRSWLPRLRDGRYGGTVERTQRPHRSAVSTRLERTSETGLGSAHRAWHRSRACVSGRAGAR